MGRSLSLTVSLLATLGAVLSACATSSGPATITGDSGQDGAPARYQVKEDAPKITALKNRNLASGQCGMLLWTLSAGSPILVFRNVEGQAAEMIVDGKVTRLELVEAKGERRYGVSAKQVFSIDAGTPGEMRVMIDASFGIPFEGGTYVEEGVITLRNFFGWERMTPVAGLVGCRA